MMETIGNVFCVGRNYHGHISELNNQIPAEPVWFMKPSHSVIFCEAHPEIIIPKDRGTVHYELELVIQMKADYLPNQGLEHVIGEVALGIDFTLRDLQSDLKKQGLPWLRAKGFKDSAVITSSLPFSSLLDFNETEIALKLNDQTVQTGVIKQMIFPLEALLVSCWEQFDLKKGDIIFTGTPAGVNSTQTGDNYDLFLNGGQLGSFKVKAK